MHVGILKTDAVRPEWVPDFGEYPDMFKRLLLEADSSVSFAVWDVEEGVHPTDGDIDLMERCHDRHRKITPPPDRLLTAFWVTIPRSVCRKYHKNVTAKQ